MEFHLYGGIDMARDMFLKIPGIKGESQDKDHKDQIDVLSWSWGAVQHVVQSTGGGRGVSKVNVADLQITKFVDASTPLLMEAACTGKHFDDVLLYIRKAGGGQQEYIKYELKNCIVSSINVAASSGEEQFTEAISLNFEEINFGYKPQKPDGTLAGNIPFGYNVVKNAKV
jgi:type VI secretion system secreted protein Hcp